MDQNGLNLVKVHGGGGYDSDFSDDESSAGASRHGDKRRHKDDLLQKPFQRGRHTKVAHKNVAAEEWDRAKDKTDLDVVRENHRFLWRDEDEEGMTWPRLSRDIPVHPLCQFSCGNKRCEKQEGLKSWEVNFAYVEQGEKRNALVKLRLCPECSYKLNYHHKRKEVKSKKRRRTDENQEELPSARCKESRHKKHKHRRKEHSSPRDSDDSRGSDRDRDESDEDTEGPSEADHWKGPAPSVEEKSREEEFDEYFEDMFL
ncbi:hypothetical protein JZ751_007790 [Albula glossodonta]|uniref:Protein FRA10AC1 n=1 Tax=Albula glossodonta TaxID=121402 RepID=A0A8T2P039_9TELE|nr:hypothetical protein JZ751_007790 [Albula glossodonta]